MSSFTLAADVFDTSKIPTDGILSRTLHVDDHVKVVLFAYSAGQELSEHTAAVPAELLFLHGTAELKLGDETRQAGPGTFIHMEAGLPHAIRTLSPVLMLLTLLKSGA